MKMNKMIVLPLLATLAIGTGAAWAASDSSRSSAAHGQETHGRHDRHHHGSRAHSPFLASLRQLNLSEAQHKSVESLLDGFKQKREANKTADRSSLLALGNPGDKNYANSVESAKSLAVARIQQRSDLESQIYKLLTAEQKAKLPQVLADLKTKREERVKRWQERGLDSKDRDSEDSKTAS